MKKILLVIIVFYSLALSNELPELGSSSDSIISVFQEKKIRIQLLYQANLSPTVLKDPEINAYMEQLGKKMINKSLKNYAARYQITLMPNISNIFYGRTVGYKIEKINLNKSIQNISGTKIRKKLRLKGKLKFIND